MTTPKVRVFASEADAERWYELRAQGLDDDDEDDEWEEVQGVPGAQSVFVGMELTADDVRAIARGEWPKVRR